MHDTFNYSFQTLQFWLIFCQSLSKKEAFFTNSEPKNIFSVCIYMIEKQNKQVQIVKSSQSSRINMKLISQQSLEDDPEKQDKKIMTENTNKIDTETRYQKPKEKSFIIKATKNKDMQLKIPRMNSQNKIKTNKILINKRTASQKKINKSKSLKTEQIFRDIIKNPLKYKIVGQVLACKPQVIYKLNKNQIDFIQQESMKIKGDRYLREALSKIETIKYTTKQPRSLPKRIKTSNSKANLSKLIEIQEIKGNKVLRKVKNHMKKGESSIFAHLNSSASIDKAFVSFLKTKIKRAELSYIN